MDRGRRRRRAWSPAARLWGRCAAGGGRRSLDAATPVRVAVLQGNIAQEDKWNPALRDAIIGRYLAMTRQALAQGATFIIWPESSPRSTSSEDLPRRIAIRRLARETGATLLIGSDQVEPIAAGRTARRARQPLLQRRVPRQARRHAPAPSTARCTWCRSASTCRCSGCCSSSARSSKRSRPSRPATEPVLLPVGDAPGEHRDLLRSDLRQPDPPVRPRRQRAADHDHQRRLVRPVVGRRTSTGTRRRCARSSTAATSRAPRTPASAASSIRTAASSRSRSCSSRRCSSQDLRSSRTRTIYTRIGDLVAWLSLAFTVAALSRRSARVQ